MPYVSVDIHVCAQNETWVVLRVQVPFVTISVMYIFRSVYG